MQKMLVAALAALLLAFAASTSHATLLGAAGILADGPVYTSQPKQQVVPGQVQTRLSYMTEIPWQWDKVEGTYPGVYPTGIGAVKRVYPNPITDLATLAMCAWPGDIDRNLTWHCDKTTKVWKFNEDSGVLNLGRDENGRFFLDIALDEAEGTGPHCIRFAGLFKDAKRKDAQIDLLIVKFKFAGKKPGENIVDIYRYKTEKWPANCAKPTPKELAELLDRAGNGGNGMVFARLLAGNTASGETGNIGSGYAGAYDDSSLLVQIANLEARVAACEAFDLKVWEAIQVVARNSGKTEAEIQRLRQLVANHQLTLVQVIEYLKSPNPTLSSSITPQKEVVHGNYCFRTSQRVWIRLYDRAYPQGRVFGPYAPGDIPINNAAIGERVNGNLVSYEYNLKYSTDGRNWSEMIIYRPGVSNVIVLPL